ncbi:hypothetical protein [Botrimarina hoheduenensis]|nr:hypothetical protein [Botrimarina hoheduenensis]
MTARLQHRRGGYDHLPTLQSLAVVIAVVVRGAQGVDSADR